MMIIRFKKKINRLIYTEHFRFRFNSDDFFNNNERYGTKELLLESLSSPFNVFV